MPESERIAADNLVNQAQRDLDAAQSCANAPAPTDPVTGAYPALKAASLEPVAALRGGL